MSIFLKNTPILPCMLWGPTMLVAWWAGYSTLGRAMPSCSMTPCRSRWTSSSDTWSAVRGVRAASLPSCKPRRRPRKPNRTAEPNSVICGVKRDDRQQTQLRLSTSYKMVIYIDGYLYRINPRRTVCFDFNVNTYSIALCKQRRPTLKNTSATRLSNKTSPFKSRNTFNQMPFGICDSNSAKLTIWSQLRQMRCSFFVSALMDAPADSARKASRDGLQVNPATSAFQSKISLPTNEKRF